MFVVALAMVFIFSFYIRSVFIDSSYMSTESNLKKTAADTENYIRGLSEDFIQLPRRLVGVTRTNAIKSQLVKHAQSKNGVHDAYYGASDGVFVSARDISLDKDNAEFRTKTWYLEAARNKGLAITGPTLKKVGVGFGYILDFVPVHRGAREPNFLFKACRHFPLQEVYFCMVTAFLGLALSLLPSKSK